MSNEQPSFDVIIAGGGLSGTLMALSLVRVAQKNNQTLSIAIIEANPVLTEQSRHFDDRVLALAHGNKKYLASLDVWPLLAHEATPIEHIHVSDRGAYGKARISAKEHGVHALGYVIEMALIGKAILAKLETYKNITWFTPDSIENIQWSSEHVSVELKSKQHLSAKLLLACDGGQSRCRQQANIQSSFHDYQQVALIANVATKQPHNNLAFERFTESGPIAMLPLSKGRCSLVWTLLPEQVDGILSLNDDDFKQVLETAFGSWLGEITQVGQRSVFPLTLVQAEQQVYHRLALIGNASHTIHPIGGQGFNLGIRDVSAFAQLFEQTIKQQRDLGNFPMLNQYAEQRASDQQQVINFTDSMVTLFSNDLCPLVLGRTIGIKLMNYVAPLQQSFVNKNMGYYS